MKGKDTNTRNGHLDLDGTGHPSMSAPLISNRYFIFSQIKYFYTWRIFSHECLHPVSLFHTYLEFDSWNSRGACGVTKASVMFVSTGHVVLQAHTGDEHQAGRWIHDREAEMRVQGA
jgi:hypothetical protein